MSQYKYYYNKLFAVLESIYSKRESGNIAKLYFEDRFGISIPEDTVIIDEDIFNSDLIRFQNGEPLQYIVGKTFFYDSFFKVNKSVLIPRPETEILVHEVINSIENKNVKILDIGTGSACIALSIAKERPNTSITAIDVSESALTIANQNKKSLNITNVKFKLMDFLDNRNWSKLENYDLIVSNPPYIKESEKKLMSDSTLRFEPKIALFPKNTDHLIFYKMIFEFAKSHLNPGGNIYCEINEYTTDELKNIIKPYNYNWEFIHDLQGKPRVLHLFNTSDH